MKQHAQSSTGLVAAQRTFHSLRPVSTIVATSGGREQDIIVERNYTRPGKS